METDMRTGTFSKTTNGFPHRIPPPTEDSDSEGLPDEYDMLQDAEQEKDIFRTKVWVYWEVMGGKVRLEENRWGSDLCFFIQNNQGIYHFSVNYNR